ncbi:hypothetical protein B0G75_1381 [Paraburkholderia sp. BL18I3N2]|uniref:hypothetical protein n=1 Tax=unclassified Paraburkholderia TaxID=2615204 RepID=UPI000D077D8F|nr:MULTISPECIES: hypothetical protein [unclassified Paraburkholderia]PRX19192.1 hypothetical protein B0G75_1381 [Paraburkholderia sp. BL18I3N2]PRX89426.1 hypothetical protein B0G73_14829 [Paraburkholderia sp. BL25I1N1]
MQTLKPVTTLSADISPEQALEVTERDGAIIIKNLFSREVLDRFLAELKPYTDARAAGSGYSDAAALVTLGQKPCRITGLAARSVTAGEVITHPLILAWAKGRRTATTVLTPYTYISIIWATLFGYAPWGETLSIVAIADIALIIGSSIAVAMRKNPQFAFVQGR